MVDALAAVAGGALVGKCEVASQTDGMVIMRPKILDLFCGAGGAGYGLYEAGFDVTGVDVKPQKRYPRNDHMRFVQADAIEYALAYGWQYDAVWASPPCQSHSQITPDKSKHVDLIPHTRFVLETLGLPYIIENVYGAKKALRNPVMLCGADFGLKVYRHRLFESNVLLLVPCHVPHRDNTPRAGHGVSSKGFISVTSGGKSLEFKHYPNNGRRSGIYGISGNGFVTVTGHFSGIGYCRMAMGVDWMTAHELAQAIPPAYSKYLGRQLMQYVQQRSEVVCEHS
jgi:DNA (cytosine-5)-methyltransferase 1